MKKNVKDLATKAFIDNNNLHVGNLEGKLKATVAAVYTPLLLFTECLGTDQFRCRNNITDGFFINMLNRGADTFGGMISLISTGHLQDAEVISRTLSESTLTTNYLLKGDVVENMSHYLASYYSGQKWKNDKWQAAIKEEYHPHNKLIEEKNTTENNARNVCRDFMIAAGGSWPDKPRSVSMAQVFSSLNKDVEYKTMYRAMCSQAHQNPEDLINNLIFSISGNPQLLVQSKEEKHCFSIFICLWGSRYFLELLLALGRYFNFPTVELQSKESLEMLEGYHEKITHSLKACEFPKGWTKSAIDGI
jgi:hypothetical protein